MVFFRLIQLLYGLKWEKVVVKDLNQEDVY